MGKKRMRTGVVRAFGTPLSIEEIPIPTPGPGEVLIKVAASGVCHTDLHAANGDWPVNPSLPFVPGHKGEGFVAACGPQNLHDLPPSNQQRPCLAARRLRSMRVLDDRVGQPLFRAT
jgi:Zn-dependent alcohol dehydrogenase